MLRTSSSLGTRSASDGLVVTSQESITKGDNKRDRFVFWTPRIDRHERTMPRKTNLSRFSCRMRCDCGFCTSDNTAGESSRMIRPEQQR